MLVVQELSSTHEMRHALNARGHVTAVRVAARSEPDDASAVEMGANSRRDTIWWMAFTIRTGKEAHRDTATGSVAFDEPIAPRLQTNEAETERSIPFELRFLS